MGIDLVFKEEGLTEIGLVLCEGGGMVAKDTLKAGALVGGELRLVEG